jgi:hypothetical protein
VASGTGILLKTSNQHFDFYLHYHINKYLWCYERWFIPNRKFASLVIFVELHGNPPADLQKACKDQIVLPLKKCPSRY